MRDEGGTLETAQINKAIRALESYLCANGDTIQAERLLKEDAKLDRDRIDLIREQLAPIVAEFLCGRLHLPKFKSAIDSINKKNEFWGFKGIKGQMFFNMLYNVSDDAELTVELQAALALPETDDMAKSRIRNFQSYVRRVAENFVEAGGSKHSCPKLSSIPFFVSYFWQIQAPQRWPVFYTNSVRVLTDMNLFHPLEDLGEAYISYVRLHRQLQAIFSEQLGREVSLYEVEHVWWRVGKWKESQGSTIQPVLEVVASNPGTPALYAELPDSFIPPIISVIPALAVNDGTLEEAAKASGTNVPRALEKSVHAAFTMLGYHAELMGQGQGRVPDGLAIAHDYSYAILWDTKARQNGYSMGTDDRTIREYITTQSRQLKRKHHLRNLYYVVVSSSFADDFDDLIRGLKMDTDINEICLMESDVLLAMVDAKLRDPNQISLGPDGLQRLFCNSGILTAEHVKEELF